MFCAACGVRILLRRRPIERCRAAVARHTMNVSPTRNCEPAFPIGALDRVIVALLVVATAATASPHAGEGVSAKTWVGHGAEIERHLQSATVVRMEAIGTGVTKPQ